MLILMNNLNRSVKEEIVNKCNSKSE